MTRKLGLALLVLFAHILLIVKVCASEPLINITDSHTDELITNQVEHIAGYPDAKWPWNVPYEGWKLYNPDTFSFLIANEEKSYTNWFRVKLGNISGNNQDVVLSINNKFLNKIDVFVKNSHGALEKVWYTGLSRGLGSKPYPSSVFSFPLRINNHNSKVVYIKTSGYFNHMLNFELQNVSKFSNNDAFDKILSGVIIGIVFLAFVYSVGMSVFLHEFRFVSYALLTSSLTVCLFITGSYMTLFANFSNDINAINIFVCANYTMLLGLLLITNEYIDDRIKSLSRLVHGILSLCLLTGAISVFASQLYYSLLFLVSCFLVMTLWFMFVMSYSLRTKNMVRTAYAFVTVLFLIGSMVPSLTNIGILKGVVFSKISFEFISLFVAVIISFMFAYRVYKERSKSKEASKQANMNKKSYIQMFKLTNEGMIFINEDGDIKNGNPAICRILGFDSITDLRNLNVKRFQDFCVEPRQFDALLGNIISARNELYVQNKINDIEKTVASNKIYIKTLKDTTGSVEDDIKCLVFSNKDDSNIQKKLVAVSVRMAEDHNGNYGLVCEVKDLSSTEIAKEQTYSLTYIDIASGAFNRNYMIKELNSLCLCHSEKVDNMDGTKNYLGFVKINNIKYINSVIGHNQSIAYLKQIVEMVSHTIKDTDADLIRLSDDRLALIIRNTYSNLAYELSKKCRDAISSIRFENNGEIYTVTSNFGLIDIDVANGNISSLLSYAEAVCNYSAANKGLNQIVIWFETADKLLDLDKNVKVASEITKAIDEKRINVLKQSIDSVNTDYIAKPMYELYVSIDQTDGTTLVPNEFDRLIEGFNILPKLDKWLVDKIVDNYNSKTVMGVSSLGTIFLNLHYETICDYDISNEIYHKLESASDILSSICIEIKERQVLSHKDVIENFMLKFSRLGVKFVLSDFSSINTVAEFNRMSFAYVKVTKDFTHKLESNEYNQIIVQSLVSTLKALKMEVIACGVENAHEYQALTSLGFEYCQGGYVSKPTDANLVMPRITHASNDSTMPLSRQTI